MSSLGQSHRRVRQPFDTRSRRSGSRPSAIGIAPAMIIGNLEGDVTRSATLEVFDEFTRSMQRGNGLPAETLRALEATGLSLEQGMREAADDLLYHEPGHLYTVAYGIDPPHLWFNEFLGNYLMEAYLAEATPTPRGRISASRTATGSWA